MTTKNPFTIDSFGDFLPDYYEDVLTVLNRHFWAMVESKPDFDRDDIYAIWAAYCSGEYDSEIKNEVEG